MTVTEGVRMFEMVGMLKTIGKTKAMVCTPGFIWVKQGTAADNRRPAGEGSTFRERKKTRVSYKEWGWPGLTR